ncbi:MAG TPA: M20 family metallopeptidase, partial [Negativicutes bacterium]|nr:M20 family metallopeptidase [Negativicutes bacterium]
PELGNEEYKACKKLSDFLAANGFSLEAGISNRPTAFRAVYDSKKGGPTIAYLCEYDALPGVGHGCGHNLIGTMSAAAGVVLSRVLDQTGGRILVIGTPAEETEGAKVDMAKQGVFDGIDAALILHPLDHCHESGYSLAMDALQFTFKGKAAHAAAEPEKGINALDGVILAFNGINALRQHVKSDVRIHGIIKEGGVAPNVVPEKAMARFYVRSRDRSYLNEITEKVKEIARGAALMTGAELEITYYEPSYDNMVTNQTLSHAFNGNLLLAGVDEIKKRRESFGSIDMGNVSHVVPAIHPYLGLGVPGIVAHTREMAKATVTENAHEMMLKGIAALSYTGYDVITDNELLLRIRSEFEGAR